MSKSFGKLFGSPSKSYQTSSTPTGYNSLSPQAQKTYDLALQNAGSLTADNFAPAPNTSEQLQAADYFAKPINTINQEQFNNGISMFSNPFEEQVLKNTIRDINQQAEGGFSDIASMASDVGGFGSNRRGLLESELQKNVLQTVGDVSSSSRASNFENAAMRTINDIGRVDSLNQQNMGSLFDIGTQFQNTATGIKNAPAQLQEYLANLAAMLAGGGASSSSTETGASEGLLQNGVVKAGLSTLMSDIRLKEDIKPVGERNGFKLYEFKYKDRAGKFIGVMAQEVEKILPSAVIDVDGYKWVDYSKLGFEMEAVHA